MTVFFRIVLCAALLLAALPAQAESRVQPGFFLTIQDMPLMPGLRELVDQSTVFDQPEGRIVSVMAVMEGAVAGTQGDKIRAFYAQTLPQLGWMAEGPAVWVREKERLTLQFGAATGGPETVRFMIEPR